MVDINQFQKDKVLFDLKSCGGKTSRSIIARRTKLKQAELDYVLEDLEREGIIQRTRLRTPPKRSSGEMISIKGR
jgi:DNA-binding HxlR family transcriptional regulator